MTLSAEKEPQNKAPSPSPEEEKGAAPHSRKDAFKEEKTKGEKVFDRTLYTGINWGLNLVISLAATILLLETTRGKFAYNKIGNAVNKIAKGQFSEAGQAMKGFTETFKKNSPHIAEFEKKIETLTKELVAKGEPLHNVGLEKSRGHSAFQMFALCTGGNLLLIPTKLAEDRKPQIVEKLEKKYDKIECPQDHNFPKKTWGDIITGRASALLTVTGIGGYVFGNAFDKLRYATQEFAHKRLPINNPTAKRYAASTIGLLPVETSLCAIAAAELYLVSKAKAALRTKKEEKRTHKEVPESSATENAAPASGITQGGKDEKEKDAPSFAALHAKKETARPEKHASHADMVATSSEQPALAR